MTQVTADEGVQMAGTDLEGRRAMVTGAAQGLGQGMAEALARAGAAVVVADVNDDLGAVVVKAVGGLDVLVNNAGVEISSLVVDVEPDDIRTMLEVNVLGTLLGVKHGLRAMRPGGVAGAGGSIINIASVAATIAFPGISAYSATKSAVDRLTRVAAAEAGKLGYGVRVNCIYPGLVPTAMGARLAQDMATLGLFPSAEEAAGAVVALTPAGRLGEVADMADAVVFLASDAARFITGAGIPVDGGMGS